MPMIADTFHLAQRADPVATPEPTGAAAPPGYVEMKVLMVAASSKNTCAEIAAAALHAAFVWDLTVEGGQYWKDIAARLNQIARDGKL